MMRRLTMSRPAARPASEAVRRPRAVLLVALGVILLSAAQLAYRLTLPTDGWAVLSSEDLDRPDWIYLANLVGAPSELRPDDRIVTVAGQPVAGMASAGPLEPPPTWAAGQTVPLTVLRQGKRIELAVPVVHWTPAALVRASLTPPELLVGFLGGLALMALALYTIWRQPAVPAARPLLLLAAAFLAIHISQMLPDGLSAQFDRLAIYGSGIFGYILFGALLGPALLAFALQFPRPKGLVQRFPWLGAAPFGLGLLVGASLLTGAAPTFGWLATVGMLLASLLCLAHAGFTQRDAVSRAQLQWAGVGLVLGIMLMLLVYPAASGMITNPLLGQLMGSGFQLGFTVIGITLGVAVLRYRLFDIEPVISNALVYLILTAGVIGVYVAVVAYLGWLLRAEGSPVLSLVATGIIAVGFAPARQLIQRWVNRLLYGERDEPYRVLSRLGQRVETAAPTVVLARAAETLAHALKLPYVAIVHRGEEAERLLTAFGQPPAAVVRVPLTYAGAPVGVLVVAPRDGDEALSRADERLLTEVARPIGVMAHAAALQDRLEQARLRLVVERGEARRRLGSDLHDRIGHQLTAVTRQVERAGQLAGADTERAHALLGEVAHTLRGITEQVRGLAHELFPPELALLGLEGAIRERAQASPHLPVQVVVPAPLPPLPAEVEAALYAIALEALTNVDKHARASRCLVQLRVGAGTCLGSRQVELAVHDDGVGLAPGRNPGMGLLSMQARAAEVGGSCEIAGGPGRGTQVRVQIPYSEAAE